MMKILNYKVTEHFEQRMQKRQIEPFLVSMCLSKGELSEKGKGKVEYILTKDKILEAIKMGYLSVKNYLGLDRLIVVVRSNILITVICKYTDMGLSLTKTKNYE